MTQMNLFSKVKARARDRVTSRDAAAAVARGAGELEQAIVDAVGPIGRCTDEDIVDLIHAGYGERWKESTIVSARARCVDSGRLVDTHETRRNRRGRTMTIWRQP